MRKAASQKPTSKGAKAPSVKSQILPVARYIANPAEVEKVRIAWEKECNTGAVVSAGTMKRLRAAKEMAERLAEAIGYEPHPSKPGSLHTPTFQAGTVALLERYLRTLSIANFPDDGDARGGARWLFEREVLRLTWWHGPPFCAATVLVELTKLLLAHWRDAAGWNQKLAQLYVDTLADEIEKLNGDAERNSAHYRPVAEWCLRWPAAFNHRPEDKGTLKAALSLFRTLGVASKNPLRGMRKLRGAFADEVVHHWMWINTERSLGESSARDVPELALPPLTSATWKAWCETGWKHFVLMHGENWEDDPEIAARIKGFAHESRYQRRERVRDSYDSTWRTLARQLTLRDSEKSGAENPESENPETHKP